MCAECNTNFEKYSGLQEHLTQDNECSEKRLVCKVCGKKFSTVEVLNKHARTHSDNGIGSEINL